MNRRRFLSSTLSATVAAAIGSRSAPAALLAVGDAGVASNFEVQLYPQARAVYAGNIRFPLAKARELIIFYAAYAACTPRELYIDGGLMSAPDVFTGVFFNVCFSGDPGVAEQVLAPLRKAGSAVMDTIRPMDYRAAQGTRDVSNARARGTWMKSGLVAEITPKTVDAIVDGFEPHPERGCYVTFRYADGATDDVATGATAFPQRYGKHDTQVLVDWAMGTDPAPHVKWLREYFASIEPLTQ